MISAWWLLLLIPLSLVGSYSLINAWRFRAYIKAWWKATK